MNKLMWRMLASFFIIFSIIIVLLTIVLNSQLGNRFNHYLEMNEMHQEMMHQSAATRPPLGATTEGQSMTHRNDMGMMGTSSTGSTGMGRGHMMMGTAETDFISTLQDAIMLVSFLGILIGGGIFYYLARSISKPVVELNKAVHRITEGEANVSVPITTNDEVGQLAMAFNEMSETLQSNTKLKQRFLDGIAHEIRTPLSVLKANLEGFADGVIKPNPKEYESLIEEVDRLTTMVEQLKELSVLTANRFDGDHTKEYRMLHLETFDISELIQKRINQIEVLGAEKELTFTEHIEPSLMITADKMMVTQIIYNLLVNAVKYTGANKMISIKVKSDTVQSIPSVVIAITDEGIGIDEKDLPHIFDYFYRADTSRTRSCGGTGLGLALVKQIVVAHNGTVSVESKLSEGSTFTVSLPVSQSN